MNVLNGIRIVTSIHLTQSGEPIKQRRTWRERLTERPWRPWRWYRWITPQVPYQGGIMLNPSTCIMHPAIYEQMKREIEKQGAYYQNLSIGYTVVPTRDRFYTTKGN